MDGSNAGKMKRLIGLGVEGEGALSSETVVGML